MTTKNIEAHVRKLVGKDRTEIIGTPLTLSDYLLALQSLSNGWTACRVDSYGRLDIGNGIEWDNDVLRFNLKTGHPATEEDWGKLGELLAII